MKGEFKHAGVIGGRSFFGEVRLSIHSSERFQVDTSAIDDEVARCFISAVEFGVTYVRNYQRRFDDWHTVKIEHIGAVLSDTTEAIMSYCAARAYMIAVGEDRDLVTLDKDRMQVSFSVAPQT